MDANGSRIFANISVFDAGCLALARVRLCGGDVYFDAAGIPRLHGGQWIPPAVRDAAREQKDAVIAALHHEARLDATDWDAADAYRLAESAMALRMDTHVHGDTRLTDLARVANAAFDRQALGDWWRAAWALAAQAVAATETVPAVTPLADAA